MYLWSTVWSPLLQKIKAYNNLYRKKTPTQCLGKWPLLFHSAAFCKNNFESYFSFQIFKRWNAWRNTVNHVLCADFRESMDQSPLSYAMWHLRMAALILMIVITILVIRYTGEPIQITHNNYNYWKYTFELNCCSFFKETESFLKRATWV